MPVDHCRTSTEHSRSSLTSVYLDWNSTAPLLPEALQAMLLAAQNAWGNPASVHACGRQARKVLEDSRDQVASLLGKHARDVLFTSGATEANNLALRSLCAQASLLVTSRLEHPSVVRVAQDLQQRGLRVYWLTLDARGLVNLDELRAALDSCDTPFGAVVALQAVNHETGVVQPVADAVEVAHEKGARIHVDAVQAVGKLAGKPWQDADTVSIASHKLGGPKGIGALAGSACNGLRPLLLGGAQENGLRPGTVSAQLAAGFAASAEWALGAPALYEKIRPLRDALQAKLTGLGAKVNGGGERVPHVCNVSFDRVRGDELVLALDVEGVCVSSGSACSAGTAEQSAVIEAMLGAERSRGAVRISLGVHSSSEQLEVAAKAFEKVLGRLRTMDEAVLEVPSGGFA